MIGKKLINSLIEQCSERRAPGASEVVAEEQRGFTFGDVWPSQSPCVYANSSLGASHPSVLWGKMTGAALGMAEGFQSRVMREKPSLHYTESVLWLRIFSMRQALRDGCTLSFPLFRELGRSSCRPDLQDSQLSTADERQVAICSATCTRLK